MNQPQAYMCPLPPHPLLLQAVAEHWLLPSVYTHFSIRLIVNLHLLVCPFFSSKDFRLVTNANLLLLLLIVILG